MSRLGFYFSIAIHSLRRGGQRVFVALLCIAFGVMSLVAMTLLSRSLERMLVINPAYLVGADISMVRQVEDVILPEQVAELQSLQRSGLIDRYTLVAYTSTLTFRLPGSGELHFPAAGIGIDPANYPLLGSFVVSRPGNVGLATLLQEPGDILVTKDIALEYHLQEGDKLVLSDLNTGSPLEAHVRAIITDTPNHQGSKLYYNLATAEQLAGTPRMLNTALLTAPDPIQARDHLAETGWVPYLATRLALGDKQVQLIFEVTLKGAAILGLLVGGIGIANTMQVLLRRRRREVAVWKTLGYRESQLQFMFAVEAAILGGLGSLLGAGVGVGLSYTLVDLFSRTSTLLINWAFDPMPVLTGILVGVLTTILFAMIAIVAASRAQPVSLLRNEPVNTARLTKLHSLGLVLLLALPFAAITSLIMGSLLRGIAILLIALFGLLLLGGSFSLLMRLLVRFLPLRGLPLAHMARNNLRRRGLSLVFAMVALFVGVVSLTLGVLVTQNAQRTLNDRSVAFQGDNLTLIALAAQETAVRQALEAQPLDSFSAGYQTSIQSVRAEGLTDLNMPSVLIARETPAQFNLEGAPWGSQPDGVYVDTFTHIPPGSTLQVTLWDGSVHSLQVVGTYTFNMRVIGPRPPVGLLLPNALSLGLAPPDTLQYAAKAPAGRLQSVSTALGNTLPHVTVINLVAYAARFTQVYHNLFIFAAAMAGLALLAGILLVANSVSLAMLDRRYEIGVLKAVGYTRSHILLTLVVEYGLIALIASGAGLGIIQVSLWFLAVVDPFSASFFRMPFSSTALIGLFCVGLTLLTVLLVTLEPTRVSPIVVLNDRN